MDLPCLTFMFHVKKQHLRSSVGKGCCFRGTETDDSLALTADAVVRLSGRVLPARLATLAERG